MKILVTAGPTREYLDPVRFISNPSTGKMGYAVAQAAREGGHRVVLVSGPTALAQPRGVRRVEVESAAEMAREARRWFRWCDGAVMAAAVGDFMPARLHTHKIKKTGKKNVWVRLVPTQDILQALGKRKGKKWLVGFAAETQHLRENAFKKLKQKKLDWIVANRIGKPNVGFGSDHNQVVVIDKKGHETKLPRMSKFELAKWLLKKVVRGKG